MTHRQLVTLGFGIAISVAWWAGHWAAGKGEPVRVPSPMTAGVSRPHGPSLPAPKVSPQLPPDAHESAPSSAASGLLQKLLNGEAPTLTPEQLRNYLALNKRNAESLLVASRLSNDLALLREAAQHFPQDAMVQLELAMRGENADERRRASEAFAALDPDNSLGSYLSAAQAFESGDADGAVTSLMEAVQRPGFNDYVMNGVQATEEAFLSAGHQPHEAKAAAAFGQPMPFLSKLNSMSKQMSELAKSYADSGDAQSATAISQMGRVLGDQVQQAPSRMLLSELVGQSIEGRFLKTFDPSATLSDGRTVQQRMDELAQRKDLIRDLTRTVDPTSAAVTPQLLSQFIDRQKVLGEAAALMWLREKVGVKQPE